MFKRFVQKIFKKKFLESKIHTISGSKYNTFTFLKQQTDLLWRLDLVNNAVEYALRFPLRNSSSGSALKVVENPTEALRWMALGFRSSETDKCQALAAKYKAIGRFYISYY